MRAFGSVLALGLLGLPPLGAEPAASAVLLHVTGEVKTKLELKAEDLARMPRRTVEAKDHDGKPTKFEGVVLADVLASAGVPFGSVLRGENLARFLLATAADGYRVVFALPELDPEFTDDVVLLADRRDGQPLPEREGPLRLVVPHEKRQARWIRQLTTLTVLTAAP
jgi:DMSO/TMAO reductase YedYZ molybdopterin-dependent catalytic subunit